MRRQEWLTQQLEKNLTNRNLRKTASLATAMAFSVLSIIGCNTGGSSTKIEIDSRLADMLTISDCATQARGQIIECTMVANKPASVKLDGTLVVKAYDAKGVMISTGTRTSDSTVRKELVKVSYAFGAATSPTKIVLKDWGSP
jgi:hypothetical protein